MSLVSRYRHIVTGVTYRIVGVAKLQISRLPPNILGHGDMIEARGVIDQLDGVEMVIYIAEFDKSVWVRPAHEFHDGRFLACE